MSQKVAKDIRRQVRAIAQEILTEEVKIALYHELREKVDKDLKALAETVRLALDNIDKRSKDINNYMLNQAAQPPVMATPTEVDKEA